MLQVGSTGDKLQVTVGTMLSYVVMFLRSMKCQLASAVLLDYVEAADDTGRLREDRNRLNRFASGNKKEGKALNSGLR
jgi:hypothetical protein